MGSWIFPPEIHPCPIPGRDDPVPSRESTVKLTPGSLSFTKGTDPSSSPFLASRMFLAHTFPCTRFLSSWEKQREKRKLGIFFPPKKINYCLFIVNIFRLSDNKIPNNVFPQ